MAYCTSPREPYSPVLLVFRVNRLFSFLFCHSPLASGRLGVTNGSKLLASISSLLESVKLTKRFAACANLLDFLNSGLACLSLSSESYFAFGLRHAFRMAC